MNKAYVVRTLQELVRAGDGYTVKGLVAWAMLNGWQPAEIALLQDTAQGVLDGRSFQSALIHRPLLPLAFLVDSRVRIVGRGECGQG